MRLTLQLISFAALAATIAPPVMFLVSGGSLDAVKVWMLGATVVWFVVTPLWMERD